MAPDRQALVMHVVLLFVAECDNHEDMDVDLDRMFLQELRDFKILTEKEYLDEHRK